MNQKMMRKNLLQTIKNSLGRYIAIIAIIALGASIFVGLLSTKADMVATGQKFMDQQNMFDLRLLNTYGWTQEHVDKIAAMSGVKDAEGALSVDVYGKAYGSEEDGVYRIHAIPDTIAKVNLLAGRMPQNADECLADGFHASAEILGKKFIVSDANDEDTLEQLKYREYTVVGYVSTPMYMDMTRGTTTLGSGSLSTYLYLPKDAFEVDYFTEIHVTLTGDHTVYSEAFNTLMEQMADTLEPDLKPLVMDRYGTLIREAEEAYADGFSEYLDGYQEFMQGKHDAYDELRDAYFELVNAQNLLEESEKTLTEGEKELNRGQDDLDHQRYILEQSRLELLASKAEAFNQLAQANATLMENYKLVNAGIKQVDDGIAQIDEGLKQLDSGITQLESGIQQLDSGVEQLNMLLGILDVNLDAAKSTLESLKNNPLTGSMDLKQIEDRITELETTRNDYVAQRDQFLADREGYVKQLDELKATREQTAGQRQELLDTKQELLANQKTIEDGMLELQSQQTQINNQFVAAEAQLQSGEYQLNAGQALLDAKRTELEDGKKTLQQGKLDLETGWEEYRSGMEEAESELSEGYQTLADAREELRDARQTIDEMEEPDLYILDRNTVPGYSALDSNSDIVAGVAKVFPAFFLAVAALVCITTMTRMVDEERTQIGVLKAMGYSSWSIISKYLYYAGSAALLGCGLGVLAGSVVFPIILWNAYCILFNITPWVVLKLNVPLCLAVVSAYTAVMLFVTWYCCRRELKEVPAELIRPKPPTSGKKILLEYMPFWKKFSFLNKVMLRNVFRYRQRFLMMMLGIGGCTALLLTGFGIKDSLTTVVNVQFSDVTVYDMEVYLDDGFTKEQQDAFREEIRSQVDQIGFFHQSSVELDFDNQTRELLLRADDSSIKNFIHFEYDGETLGMPGLNEVFLSVGTAEQMGIQVGDLVTVRNADMQKLNLRVAGIFENHVSNFMVVLPQTILEQWGSLPEEQMAFITIRDYQDPHETAAKVTGMDGVMNVSVSQDTADVVNGMMDALLLVVATIVICASLLAIIVLYNLININITERLREIATIKVLGFTDAETSAYVFKENIMLSVMGAGAGLVFGIWLLDFVISCIKIDMVWFKPQLAVSSYLLSLVITMISAFAVDFIFHFKLQKINMAEALKSVE